MAVLSLLTAPSHGLDAILQCIALLGADGAPVTEEAMANSHVWRQFQLPNWTQLLRVTEESFCIMCKRIVAEHEVRIGS